MYQSPIEIITKKMLTQLEDNVFKAIQNYGIVVDKEELIKALQYDRDQYEKGYADGMLAQKDEWISVEERLPMVEEQARGLVGIVNGFNGKIRFENARVFLNYDYNFDEWYSQDYDIQNCKIECWMPLPEAPKMKGGAE